MDTKKYQITLVYAPDDTFEKLEKTVDELLEKSKVKVIQKDDWGQKTLAYPIKKYDEAIFHHLTVEAKPAAVEVLKNRLRIEHGILRWLLLNEEETSIAKATEDK